MDTAIPLSGAFPVARLPTPADVAAIAAIDDPCLRNVRITHTYHLLASAFGAVAGPGASWCIFAVWASKQAGQTIHGEDALQVMESALRTRPQVEAALDGMFRRVVRAAFGRPGSRRKEVLRILGIDAFHRASAAVAAGNLKVFAEIGREFARFLPLCAGGRVDPRALWAATRARSRRSRSASPATPSSWRCSTASAPPGDADGAGADDWSVLDERMLLIARFFRCRHEDRGLFGAPFTPEQVRESEAGRVPGGVL